MAYAQFYTLPASAHIVMCINNACSAAVAAFLSFGYCENGFLCGRSKHYKHQLLCKSQGPVPWLPRLLVLYCIWVWATRRSCAVVQAVILGEFSLLAAGITAARPVDIAESAKLSERRFLLHSFMNMHAPCVAPLLPCCSSYIDFCINWWPTVAKWCQEQLSGQVADHLIRLARLTSVYLHR